MFASGGPLLPSRHSPRRCYRRVSLRGERVNRASSGACAVLGESSKARMARTDFHSPRLHVSAPLAEGAAIPLSPEQANYLVNVLRLPAGARVLGLQRARRRIRRFARRARAQECGARRRRANPGSGIAPRRRFPVRAAEARQARLHGAEGGRDGRATAEAGDHPAHPGRAAQPRAARGQRHRGLRAMRRDLDAGNSPAGAARQGALRMAGRAPARLLRRGRAAGRPARGAFRRRRRRPASASSSGPKAASTKASGRRSSPSRASCGSASGRASCGPTRPRSPRSRSSRRPWEIGGPAHEAG